MILLFFYLHSGGKVSLQLSYIAKQRASLKVSSNSKRKAFLLFFLFKGFVLVCVSHCFIPLPLLGSCILSALALFSVLRCVLLVISSGIQSGTILGEGKKEKESVLPLLDTYAW